MDERKLEQQKKNKIIIEFGCFNTDLFLPKKINKYYE